MRLNKENASVRTFILCQVSPVKNWSQSRLKRRRLCRLCRLWKSNCIKQGYTEFTNGSPRRAILGCSDSGMTNICMYDSYESCLLKRAVTSCVEPSIFYCDTCDPENRQESSHKCVECNDWLCSVCASFHKRTKLTRDHMILTMVILTTSGAVPTSGLIFNFKDDVESGKHTTDVKNRAKIFCMVWTIVYRLWSITYIHYII